MNPQRPQELQGSIIPALPTHRHDRTFAIVGLLAFVLAPSVWLSLLRGFSLLIVSSVLLHFLCLMLLILSLLTLLQFMRAWRIVHVLCAIAGWGYILSIFTLLGYWTITGQPLDIYFVTDTLSDAFHFAMLSLSTMHIVAIIGTAFALSAVYFFFIRSAERLAAALMHPEAISKLSGIPAIVLCIALLLPSQAQLFGFFEVSRTPRAKVSEILHAIIPDNSSFQAQKNGESFFMLQLESQNAIALEGKAVVSGKTYEGYFMPHQKEIARDGVNFPMVWSNSIQTNRAQESLFCGVVNNLGRGLSINAGSINTVCMPSMFRQAGYKTIVFRADDLSITDFETFYQNLGFEEIYQKEIMAPEDKMNGTIGYDDCLFYQRVFEFLQKKYPDPSHGLFVYLEVSNNHYPFKERGYTETHQFTPAQNFVETYLNSSLEQDFCLGKFYEHFQRYSQGKMHLMISPDNSWPVGIAGSTLNAAGAHTEHFLIPMTYVPPMTRRKEFLTGQDVQQRCSQADYLPTVLELTTQTSFPNSCVPFMQLPMEKALASAPYEDCHLLTQPYGGGRVLIARGNSLYVYALDTQELTLYDLAQDLLLRNPQLIGYLPYADVVQEYFCERYRPTAPTPANGSSDNEQV